MSVQMIGQTKFRLLLVLDVRLFIFKCIDLLSFGLYTGRERLIRTRLIRSST